MSLEGNTSFTSKQLHDALYRHYGFNNFKPLQEEICQSVLDGNDTFVIMPTGGGKSLTYQLPALLMEGTAIIISPLIALMKDQVDSIRGYSKSNAVAHFLNSSLNRTQIKEVKDSIVKQKTKMLFIAPETLTKEENIEFFQSVNLSFLAVDEAHCISEWGHDFRPEYRRIRTMVDQIDKEIPIIALTATATEKVRTDIVKNLNMKDVSSYISSFNRFNLFYEVRPKKTKEQAINNIVKIIKSTHGKSGIVYVQSRKSTEEIAEILKVNGIKASPYHAGLDSKTRTRIQDDFLMEEIDVICATIAFGMGIDKPDVRFVIHYDIPKSIENYYQETGRAGRDGLEAKCIAFYSHDDILKLEKFLRDKPVSERELTVQLMDEIIAYSETGSCRRKFLLHYFGENIEEENCNDMCDNCKNPKDRVEAKDDFLLVLKITSELHEKNMIKSLVDFVIGKKSKEMKDFRYNEHKLFGSGESKDEHYWHSIIRQALLNSLLYKDIELYGVIKLTDEGRQFIEKPYSIEVPLNHDYEMEDDEDAVVSLGGHSGSALDEVLFNMLKDLRHDQAKSLGVKPWVIFSDPALQDMSTFYPISLEDMLNISGVSKGKAERYGQPFIKLIRNYVQENEIDRPTDYLVRQVANKSKTKVAIIQHVDRKIPLEDIAVNVDLTLYELLDEMYAIVSSGTKLNIDYYIKERIESSIEQDIYDYFLEAESDSLDPAFEEFQDDDEISEEDIQLVRIKFISDMAN
ncbi:MAG: RecQ family ATP-dependent DNA helicase [Saprospiraceae bacterium]|nr:RecQ family ATP-dependent DNA helicase [Saprospiraceae bacterium]